AELRHHLDVGVEIGQHDDLADLGILVAAAADRGEPAPPAGTAAGAPADVLLAGIALGQRHVLGGAGVDEVERDRRLALLDVDAAGQRADRAAPAAEMAEDAANRRARAAAAAILVGGDDVRLHEIIRRLHLAATDVRAGLQLAIVGHRPLHRPAAHG